MPDGAFFETPRLRARPFRDDDLEPFVAYRRHPEVERYQSWSDYTLEQGRTLVASAQRSRPGVPGEWYQLALEERGTGRLVGDLALHVDAGDPRLGGIGFSLAPDHHGKGFAAEGVDALLDYSFGVVGLHRVVAVTDVRNEAAAAVLRRVGMRLEGHFVENVFFKGAWGSELLFALLARERSDGLEAPTA